MTLRSQELLPSLVSRLPVLAAPEKFGEGLGVCGRDSRPIVKAEVFHRLVRPICCEDTPRDFLGRQMMSESVLCCGRVGLGDPVPAGLVPVSTNGYARPHDDALTLAAAALRTYSGRRS